MLRSVALAVTPAPSAPTPGREVLLVDDDEDIRETVRGVLEARGYEVQVAVNGHEAFERLGTHGRPALIILDLMMPVMNGWQVLDRLEADEALRSTSVIVVSAAGERAVVRQPVRVIQKPFRLKTLLEAVTAHCGPPAAGAT